MSQILIAVPDGVPAPPGTWHHPAETVRGDDLMTKEKLFELAVQIAAANISAGQYNNGLNFGTVVHDDTETAFYQLEALWEKFSQDTDANDDIPDEPTGENTTH